MTMDLSSVTLEGSIVRLGPLTLGHVDALSEVGLDASLRALTTIRVQSRDDKRDGAPRAQQ